MNKFNITVAILVVPVVTYVYMYTDIDNFWVKLGINVGAFLVAGLIAFLLWGDPNAAKKKKKVSPGAPRSSSSAKTSSESAATGLNNYQPSGAEKQSPLSGSELGEYKTRDEDHDKYMPG